MKQQNESVLTGALPPPSASLGVATKVPRGWLIAVGVLVVLFSWPLFSLVHFALTEELYSHIILVPIVAGYFAWHLRHHAGVAGRPDHRLALALLVGGSIALAGWFMLLVSAARIPPVDRLALSTSSFVLSFWGICAWYFSVPTLWQFAFPLGFLVFLVPFPSALFVQIETFLQYGSAHTAFAMFQLLGTTLWRQDLIFRLPGITLEVAPECSGIHSTLALFITSTIAAYLYLKSPWRRVALVAAVLPLALLRNGFRIVTIGELCVHIGPDMINSYIHRHGGPIFFTLSLVPFAFILVLLKRSERRGSVSHRSSSAV